MGSLSRGRGLDVGLKTHEFFSHRRNFCLPVKHRPFVGSLCDFFVTFFFAKFSRHPRKIRRAKKSLTFTQSGHVMWTCYVSKRHMSPKRVHCLNSLPFTNRNFSKKGPKISAEVDESLYFSQWRGSGAEKGYIRTLLHLQTPKNLSRE